MDFIELEKLYKFSVDNDIDITKHGVTVPSQEVAEKLRDKYKIRSDIKKYIQVLDDKKTVSFVFTVGNITLFERVCWLRDEYEVEPYNEEESEEI